LENTQGKRRSCLAPIPRGRSDRRSATPPWYPPLAHPSSLILALDKYRPETSRSTRSLSRFPNRNRFISDYIYHVTGKRRTAKQVGSRLQQLRDTCGGKRSQRISRPISSRSHIDDPLQSSSFYLTVTSLHPQTHMRSRLPSMMHMVQMAALLARPPRNVSSLIVDMPRSAPPAHSCISMCSLRTLFGLHQMMRES